MSRTEELLELIEEALLKLLKVKDNLTQSAFFKTIKYLLKVIEIRERKIARKTKKEPLLTVVGNEQ